MQKNADGTPKILIRQFSSWPNRQISWQAQSFQKKPEEMNLSSNKMNLRAVFDNGVTEGKRIIQDCNRKKNCLLFGRSTKIMFYEGTQERQRDAYEN